MGFEQPKTGFNNQNAVKQRNMLNAHFSGSEMNVAKTLWMVVNFVIAWRKIREMQ